VLPELTEASALLPAFAVLFLVVLPILAEALCLLVGWVYSDQQYFLPESVKEL